LAALPLLGFWTYGLFDLDEGFYAAVTGEMLRRGDWITPHYNGAPWFEKPILLYWISTPFVALLGQDWGPRFSSFLCALAMIGAVWAFGQRFAGQGAGWRAALALATSLLAIAIGRMMMTDAAFVLALTLALLTFWRSLVEDVRWRVLSGALLGVSVLAKGPAGCAFFVLIAAWTFWREPGLRARFRGGWALGTLAFLAVVGVWYLPAYLMHPGLFFEEFIIRQNIGRFVGGDKAHAMGGIQGALFYPAVLLVGFFPWCLRIWSAWPRRSAAPEAAFLRYLAAWAAIVFLFFFVAEAKLPHYILPCLPPLALLVGAWMARREGAPVLPARRDWLAYGAGAAILFAIANGASIWWYRASGHAELHAHTRWLEEREGEVVEFQMSRREAGRGTGGMRLMETSHPSIVFYLDRVVPKPATFEALLDRAGPAWVLTREDRIKEEDVELARRAGVTLTPAATPAPQDRYRVWRLERTAPAPEARSGCVPDAVRLRS
jgi:4-amino-4-deoxy-L-arabinose transferase-like glycosyltransferase